MLMSWFMKWGLHHMYDHAMMGLWFANQGGRWCWTLVSHKVSLSFQRHECIFRLDCWERVVHGPCIVPMNLTVKIYHQQWGMCSCKHVWPNMLSEQSGKAGYQTRHLRLQNWLTYHVWLHPLVNSSWSSCWDSKSSPLCCWLILICVFEASESQMQFPDV